MRIFVVTDDTLSANVCEPFFTRFLLVCFLFTEKQMKNNRLIFSKTTVNEYHRRQYHSQLHEWLAEQHNLSVNDSPDTHF